jgi:hypothetical protein
VTSTDPVDTYRRLWPEKAFIAVSLFEKNRAYFRVSGDVVGWTGILGVIAE